MVFDMRKLENWLTYGGAILALFTFFNIDFSSVYRWTGGLSGRSALALVGATLFVIGLVLKLRERKVRIGNVQRKIDRWLRASNFAFRENLEWPSWYFGFQITEPGVRTWVARVKGRGRENYILLTAPIIPFSKIGKEVYDKLTPEKQDKLFKKLMFQTAMSKTNATYDLGKNTATINRRLPISPNLTESDFLSAVNDIWFSAQIIWNTINLELPEKEVSDKEEPPPTEAS